MLEQDKREVDTTFMQNMLLFLVASLGWLQKKNIATTLVELMPGNKPSVRKPNTGTKHTQFSSRFTWIVAATCMHGAFAHLLLVVCNLALASSKASVACSALGPWLHRIAHSTEHS